MGTDAGRVELGVGAGGDRTVELDRLAEEVALAELRRFAGGGHPCSVLSEEMGLVELGATYPMVLLDPIDGSLNAKQGLPFAAVLLALANGPTLADLRLGLVLNLISAERWHVVRGCGFYRNGRPVTPLPALARSGRFNVLGVESSPRSIFALRPLIDRASKLRLLGSMALALAHTAAGGIEVLAVPIEARIFDLTAGWLMVREVGGAVSDLEGRSLEGVTVGLERRTTLLASADAGLHGQALDVLRGNVRQPS